MARVVVVGLGPGGADLLLARARTALASADRRLVRTARHPAVVDLTAEGMTFEPLDAFYERADDLDDVYPRIAAAVIDAAVAAPGSVIAYAVPGNPVVAERSVAEVRRRASDAGVTVEVVPGLSFADLAWARLGVDPMAGARVVDGRALEPEALEAGGPVLFAQVDDRFVCSDLKLALLERLPADAPVTVLQRLGLPDEQIAEVPLAELDRVVVPDHLTSCFAVLPPGPADTFGTLVALARRLRGPGGCPWDAEQTHHSLTRYLIEETYEVVDALAALPPDVGPDADPEGALDDAAPEVWAAIADELGDLLFQVVFHAVLAEEEGVFTAADVATGIHDKLVRRHPHVFGDVEARTGDDVVRNWEQIKKDERGSASLVDSVPTGLPALLYTHKLFRKAAAVGLDPADRVAATTALADAVAALADPASVPDDDLVGGVLAAAVALARAGGVDAEAALRRWAADYRQRFMAMEDLARAHGHDLAGLAPDAVADLWAAAGGD